MPPIQHGKYQALEVVTEPPGATATAGDQRITTPGVLTLRRKEKGVEVRIEKDGYLTQRISLSRESSKSVWLNTIPIVAGLLVGGEVGNRTAQIGAASLSSSRGLWHLLALEQPLGEIAVGALVGAVVLGGISVGSDYVSGAAYRLDPPQIKVAPGTPCSPHERRGARDVLHCGRCLRPRGESGVAVVCSLST